MYSVVLMAALSASPASTGQWFSHSCSGCHGCHGWGYATYSCNGCHGCYGCHGCSGYTRCSGSYACYGCSGYNYGVGHGYQSSFSVYAPVACTGCFGCTGCYGCYGGWSCYGAPLPNHGYWNECAPAVGAPGVAPPSVAPPAKNAEPKAEPKIEEVPLPKEKEKEKKDLEVRARLTIDAPADAKLFVDGQLVNVPAAKRVFTTPALTPGHTYYYNLRVEVVRDGRTVSETQRVILQPGQTASAAFPTLTQDVTAAANTER